jgi:phosphoglycerate dehydrogenase-like enzyme
MRVAFAGRIARELIVKRLEAMPNVEFTAVGDLTELVPLLPTTDVLIVSDPRGAEGAALAAGLCDPKSAVRWIQVVSAGADGLLAHEIPPSITVTNQGGAVAPNVAEHTLALMLALARQIGPIYEASQRHEWQKTFDPPTTTLERRTLAIVGMGNVGRHIARRAKSFDMSIVGVSRTAKAEPLADEMFALADLHAALGRADIVVICLALTPGTVHLIDAAGLAAMKAGAWLINVSRGETVDGAALRAALISGHIGRAALDVTEPEPLPPGDLLWAAPNLIISPHAGGGGGRFTSERISAMVVDNLERYMSGKPLLHQVEF